MKQHHLDIRPCPVRPGKYYRCHGNGETTSGGSVHILLHVAAALIQIANGNLYAITENVLTAEA